MGLTTRNKASMWAAAAFVVANMVGTGVFTSLGFQLVTTSQIFSIMMLWLLGGVIAFCGALCYAELGAAMPRSGGEYHYLSTIYHPSVGFLSGWVSLVVGFAAPVALTCMALASYMCRIYPMLHPRWIALGVLLLITLVHTRDLKLSSSFQMVFTILKVVLIVAFIVCGLVLPAQPQDYSAQQASLSDVFSAGFAVSLIWVYYAYSGWNASTYMASEIDNPQKNIPRSLILSTAVVTVLYLLLNYVFLRSTPTADLTGQIEVGLISARNIFGDRLGNLMGLVISLLLLSSISSMVFMGPRVAQVMGEDHRILRFLSFKDKKGVPLAAIGFQFVISVLLIITDSFEMITKYTGILLSLCSLLTVIGVFVHRRKFPNAERPYKTLGYPVTPIVFSALIVWSIVYLVHEDYTKTFIAHEQSAMWMSIMSFCTLLAGFIVYLINIRITKKQASK
ncbi:MAG: amino acid permease [Bacteroidales bacterium]|nr:amino acid permease [Bacteroidales bacterium]